tara:strand:- start:558 stop:1622 length:1065 start_codon:yes stop_codon:yes gene_type:complete
VLNPVRTIELIKGAFFDAEATWRSYLPESDDWQKTALLLTVPLIITAAILGYAIGFFSAGSSLLGLRPTLLHTLVTMLMSAISAGMVAFIVSALAGMFDGKASFARGLAATSLAFVPGYLGQALNWLPWIGTIVALALFVYALVLLWCVIPVYLDVPDNKRAAHYITTLVVTIIAMAIISMALRPIIAPAMPDMPSISGSTSGEGPKGIGGVIGEAMRQGELMEAAGEDQYEPPSDGKLKESQVREFARIAQRAGEIMDEKAERIRELSERAEKDEELSISEMSEMMRGATSMMGMHTIELELVKSSGGNWAEYEWVKNTLRTAYVQKDINASVAHNYALYEKYEDELRPLVAH